MSFHQNTSNQWAPQERSEPEANSSPAPLWTGIPTYAQSAGNAASFGEQIESDTNSFNEFNNDGNSDHQNQEFVSLFSNEEPSHEDESDSNEEPRVSSYLPVLSFILNKKLSSKADLQILIESTIKNISRRFLSGVQTPAVQEKKLRAELMALEIVVRSLVMKLPTNSYNLHLNWKVESLRQHINTSTSYIQENILQHEKDAQDIEPTVASIRKNIEILKAWNRRQDFLCGQSEKFTNVVCAKDLLPQNDGPTICGICLSTVEETSDFAVQSDCTHIFCTPCITAWFKIKKSCPMCRQSGLFMSKGILLGLRSHQESFLGFHGPELAH